MEKNFNLYATLGVRPDADEEVIGAAYRALVKKYHPDTSAKKDASSAERFRKIQEAYDVLRSPESRRKYDEAMAQAQKSKKSKPKESGTSDERSNKEDQSEKRKSNAAPSEAPPTPPENPAHAHSSPAYRALALGVLAIIITVAVVEFRKTPSGPATSEIEQPERTTLAESQVPEDSNTKPKKVTDASIDISAPFNQEPNATAKSGLTGSQLVYPTAESATKRNFADLLAAGHVTANDGVEGSYPTVDADQLLYADGRIRALPPSTSNTVPGEKDDMLVEQPAYQLLADAEAGDPEAQFRLASRYYFGSDAKEDDDFFAKKMPLGGMPSEALKWYEASAKQGHPQALYNLGVIYRNGDGVQADNVAAYKWFSIAASSKSMKSLKAAQDALNLVAKDMTSAEIKAAENQANNWMATYLKR